jgi:amino acid adenylation domain-containing protein
MHDDGTSFHFTWLYATCLFERHSIERFAAQFSTLLDDALERSEVELSRLSLSSSAERRQILVDWKATIRSVSAPPSVPAMVEAQAQRTPERVAIVAEGCELTYRQVNGAANHLAARLRAAGIGRGDFVPLLIEASAELLIAELAVMKAGAAFVPLDPGWPRQRLVALLSIAGSRVVVVRHADARYLVPPDREALPVRDGSSAQDVPDLGLEVGADDPIYCIFTSGSTGLPKGAVNAHRGIVNRFSVMTRLFGAPAEDAVLVTSPPFADSSVWQFFWPLTGGGRSVVFPPEQAANPRLIAGLIRQHGITFMDHVPSLLRLLVLHLRHHPEDRPGFAHLRRMLVGGEAMAADVVYELKAMLPHLAVTNTYGPTETSIGVIFQEVPESYTDPIPIGRPIDNVRAVILDRSFDLAPVGVAGELCLGGACVGLGYLGDREATARAFIANPFPELGCATLYRTGDRARFWADGTIEYLGRIDGQMKLRGLRIEPGEIEQALMRHPDVRQAAVVLLQDEPDDRRLLAYLVAEPRASLYPAALQEFLAQMLPPIWYRPASSWWRRCL